MNQKQLNKARELINLVEIYNFLIICLVIFTFSAVLLKMNIIISYFLVMLIILFAISKHLHIERYLKDEKEN